MTSPNPPKTRSQGSRAKIDDRTIRPSFRVIPTILQILADLVRDVTGNNRVYLIVFMGMLALALMGVGLGAIVQPTFYYVAFAAVGAIALLIIYIVSRVVHTETSIVTFRIQEKSNQETRIRQATVTLGTTRPRSTTSDNDGLARIEVYPHEHNKLIPVRVSANNYQPFTKQVRPTYPADIVIELIPDRDLEPPTNLEYYIYISDQKVASLDQPVIWTSSDEQADRLATERIPRLIKQLHAEGRIGALGSNQPFIEDEIMMRWGVIDWNSRDMPPTALFSSILNNTVVLLMGAAYHVVSSPHALTKMHLPRDWGGAGGSSHPGILQAIRVSSQYHAHWTPTTKTAADYLFALGLAHDELINTETMRETPGRFPSQRLKFVARTFPQLEQPTRDQLQAFTRRLNLNRAQQQRLEAMLTPMPRIVLGTPIYVATAD